MRFRILIIVLFTVSGFHIQDSSGYSLKLIKTYMGKQNLSTLGQDACSFDYNGDGINDLILSAMNESNHRGRTYLICGDILLPDLPCFIMSGEETKDFFGYSIANAGDVNNDSWDDFIVGAYQQGVSFDPSTTYIYFGGPSADSSADVTFQGSVIRDYFGYAVAGAGDLNNDGYEDVVVGADDGEGGLGRAYFYFGGNPPDTVADLVVTGFLAHGHIGASTAGLGDINGDGSDDVLVGAHSINAGDLSYGYAEIFFGGENLDESFDLLVVGQSTYSMFGWAAAGCGDLNGDGYNDFIVGAKTDYAGGVEAGRAYLFYGGSPPDSTPDVIFTGEDEGDQFGFDVKMIGDINMDGYNDIAVGAAYAGPEEQGKVYVFFGSPTGPDNTADITLRGENSGDEFGYSLARTVDLNQNGLPDFSIGAKKNDENASNAGKAYVYELPPLGVGIDQPVPGVYPGDTLSFTVRMISHVDTALTVQLSVVLRPDTGTIFTVADTSFHFSGSETILYPLEVYITPGTEPGEALIRATLEDTMGEDIDHGSATVEILEPIGIDDDDLNENDPRVHAWLYQNIPNPFNPQTEIRFDIEEEGDVLLRIFDVRGRTIRTILDERCPAGSHRVLWDGTDELGIEMPSGVYFYRILSSGKTMIRKMVLSR